MLTCTNHTFDLPKWWLGMDLSLRHSELCPVSRPHLRVDAPICPRREHDVGCSVIPVEIFRSKGMLLLNFSSHFFEVNASTTLDLFIYFFNAQRLTFGGENKSQISICVFFIWVFLVTSVCALQAVLSAGASSVLPPFTSHSIFVRAAWLGTVQSCMHVL